MTEKLHRLVSEIRQRTQAVTSFVATYKSVYGMQLMPFEATGKIHFLSPDKARAETVIKNSEIISIRRGTKVQRYITKRKELWTYDLEEWPQTEPLNFGVADLRDPFFAIDETTIAYNGTVKLDKSSEHIFNAQMKNLGQSVSLDTRKGFNIKYQSKVPEISIQLKVDSETGLLRSMIGSEKGGKVIFQLDYYIEAINIPIDDSIFEIDESTTGYKTIDIREILMASMNPDAADAPPSIN